MPRRSRSASFATASEGSRAGRSKSKSARVSATPVADDEMDIDGDIEADLDEVEGFLDDVPDELHADMQDEDESEEVVIEDSQPVRRVFDYVFVGAPPRKFKRDTYRIIEGEDRVLKVLEESEDGDELSYLVRFGDMRHERVSFSSDVFQSLPHGPKSSGITWPDLESSRLHLRHLHS